MKLIQYRFTPDDLSNSSYVGDRIKEFFILVDDLSIHTVGVEPKLMEKIIRKPVSVDNLAVIASDSFVESFSRSVDLEKQVSFKSTESCRFVDFYDDGLVRVCYSNDDEIIRFDRLSPEVTDISEWLIKTDFFDNF